jgi:hypothetical protein
LRRSQAAISFRATSTSPVSISIAEAKERSKQESVGLGIAWARQCQEFSIRTRRHFQHLSGCVPANHFRQLRPLSGSQFRLELRVSTPGGLDIIFLSKFIGYIGTLEQLQLFGAILIHTFLHHCFVLKLRAPKRSTAGCPIRTNQVWASGNRADSSFNATIRSSATSKSPVSMSIAEAKEMRSIEQVRITHPFNYFIFIPTFRIIKLGATNWNYLSRIYDRRRQILVRSLKNYLGERVKILGDNAGIHLMARIDSCFQDEEIIQAADKLGVGLVSTQTYYFQGQYQGQFLFGYAELNEEQIEEGIRRLSRVFV